MISCSVLPSEGLEHGFSFVLICCKVLVSFSFFFYSFFCVDLSVLASIKGGILLLSLLTYTLARDVVVLMASFVTYIRQCGILLLGLLTYTLSRDFVMPVASFVTYICQGGILLLGLLTYTLSRDFVMPMASFVTDIRQGGILLLGHSVAYNRLGDR